MAAVRSRAVRQCGTRAIVAAATIMALEFEIGIGRSLEFMATEEKAPGATAYTTFAAVLMVCLLAFGTLHTFGVFR